jgi:hypothetical protein
MAKVNITPDSLASKTFLLTVVGALLYIGVVFAFVIGGNRREDHQGTRLPESSVAHPIEHSEHMQVNHD